MTSTKRYGSGAEQLKAPFEKGLLALYKERYAEASDFLSSSLEIREQKEERATAATLDAARFLGRALYQKGQYLDSATAFQKAVDRRNDDPLLLNALGLSFHKAGNYTQAEPLYQRALAINEKRWEQSTPRWPPAWRTTPPCYGR